MQWGGASIPGQLSGCRTTINEPNPAELAESERFGLRVADVEIEKLVAVAAAYLGDFNRPFRVNAGRVDVHAAPHTEDSGFDPGLEHEIWARIGHRNARDGALITQVRTPGATVRGRVDQSALLAIAAASEVFKVVLTFRSGWCAHSQMPRCGC